jgi:hypothetical protein
MREHQLVTIRTYRQRIEAEIARSVLEAEGIQSLIQGDDPGSRAPVMLPATIALIVRATDARRAADILGPE